MKKRLNFKCLDYRYMSHQKNIINTSKILKSCRSRIKDFAISAIVVIAVWIIDTWWCICSVHTWDMENCKGYLVRIQEFEIWVVLRYRLWQNKKYINNWKKQIEIVCVCRAITTTTILCRGGKKTLENGNINHNQFHCYLNQFALFNFISCYVLSYLKRTE
jgi:hypothetical protein